MKVFLLKCVSFVLISRVFSNLESQESISETNQPSIDAFEINMEHLNPEQRKEIMKDYLDSLPSVEHWIDPYDMIGSSVRHFKREMEIKDTKPIATEEIISDTINEYATNNKKPASDPKSPATDSKVSPTDQKKPSTDPKKLSTDSKKSATNVKISETGTCNAASDSCKASAVPNEQKVFCALDSIYVTRWIKKILYRIEKESDNESSTISFSLDTTTLESLKEMSNAKLFEISTFDDIISNLLSQAVVSTKEPFTWYRTFLYYSDMLWVILYSLGICGVVYVIHRCFIIHPMKTLICSVIVISVFWHWMHLYKQQIAIHHAELASMQVPTQCRKHDLGLLEHINEYFKSWFATNDCSKYYEALLVDPFWKVSITMAISEAFTAFVFQPLFAASRAINVCIKQLFDGLPIHLTVTLIVFIFLLALILRDYSVRFFWFTGIEPVRRSGGSRVEEVPHPTFMQSITQAVRNAISDNPSVAATQSQPMQSIPADSLGSSERPRSSISNSMEPDTNRTNSKDATSIAPTKKNPEDEVSILPGYFDVHKSVQLQHEPKVGVNTKCPKIESISSASSETIPKTLAIEDTYKVEFLPTKDVPSSSKADEKDQEQEASNLKNTLSDSFEVLPIPSDEDSNIQSFCSAGPSCDTSMDLLEELHKGCRYCQ